MDTLGTLSDELSVTLYPFISSLTSRWLQGSVSFFPEILWVPQTAGPACLCQHSA